MNTHPAAGGFGFSASGVGGGAFGGANAGALSQPACGGGGQTGFSAPAA